MTTCPAFKPDDIVSGSKRKHTMKIKSVVSLSLLAAACLSASCVPLAVGAAAGYVAHDEGYRVQNPIKKR